ncbi:unnamed protein product [Coregonus sp. 'balchen']|nr:unnamed protein product [Coregonus sp. 'balchen']
MLCSQLQELLVALSASVLLARVSIAPHRDDLSRILLLKMSDLMTTAAGENEVLPDLEEALGVRSEVVRQLPLSQRELKLGCRNFF